MELFDTRLPNRFWDKVMPEPNSGCWLWIASRNSAGYGTFGWNNTGVGAHRVAAEVAEGGQLPDGYVPDHKCRNRLCVNPYHMEIVTYSENSVRANKVGKAMGAKTHCPQGHPYDEDNTYWHPGRRHRQCRACLKIAGQKRRLKMSANKE